MHHSHRVVSLSNASALHETTNDSTDSQPHCVSNLAALIPDHSRANLVRYETGMDNATRFLGMLCYLAQSSVQTDLQLVQIADPLLCPFGGNFHHVPSHEGQITRQYSQTR